MIRSASAKMSSSTHPKAPSYLQRGIFDGLKNFRELEARISALPTPQERGEAFEVFAEAYLATVAVEKARQVWPGGARPAVGAQAAGSDHWRQRRGRHF